MALNYGLVHQDEANRPDDPEAQLNSAEWNKAHIVNKQLDITPTDTVPAAPATGFREFWIDSGVTPNRRIYHGLILADGTEIPIYDVLV